MNLCNEHKAEICFDSRECPACLIQAELTEAEERISSLEDEVRKLESDLLEAREAQ